jgi:hypothetical protein
LPKAGVEAVVVVAAALLAEARVVEQAVLVAVAVAADPWEAVRRPAAVPARAEAHQGAEQVLEVLGRAKVVVLQDRPAVAMAAMLVPQLVKIHRLPGLFDRLF